MRRPMTLRALVAQLRRNATVEEHNPALAHAAAAQLHRLADAQVPGAHPRQWWGCCRCQLRSQRSRRDGGKGKNPRS